MTSRWGVAPIVVPVLVLAAGALGGCGGDDAQPEVASLPTSPAAVGSSSPAGTGPGSPSAPASGQPQDGGAGPPQFRLDDSDARRTALINAWSQCLLHHGAKRGGRDRAGAAGSGTTALIVVADPVPPAASAACRDLLPEMPPETEASTNPDFHEQSLAYVGCMRTKGLWVQLLNDHDLDWTYVEDHAVPEDSSQIEHDCLLSAFGS